MPKKKRLIALTLIFLIGFLVLASTINFAKATSYNYILQGPFFLNGIIATGNTAICNLLWSNYTTTQVTLTTSSPTVLSSSVQLYQITWNSSSVLNYTSLIDFQNQPATTTYSIKIFIPDPSYPFSQYTFSITDFYGMTNPYLRMTVNNASGVNSDMAEQVNLNSAGVPSFIMTQYYTYTLTFICDQGTYSQLFTAESVLSNTLIVLAGAFPIANTTVPTANVERLNSTLIGITYNDPSNLTSSGTVIITHQSGVNTINDYSTTSFGNTTTILWNAAIPNIDFNVNITSTINGVTYIWNLVAPSTASTNPFSGVFDWLGQNINTMPKIYTGWPTGMTSANIAEIVAACIVMLFLCVGSFRSAGACCIISWAIMGILIYLGWAGTITPYTIPEFALSGFVGLIIHLTEAKDTAREV